MTELLRLVEEPRPCTYLPDQTASLEYRFLAGLEPAEYGRLLTRGYRRFGHQLFRPACARCQQCISLRILVREFEPTRSQRRVLRQNRCLRVERQRVFVTGEHVNLFNRYHRFMAGHRGWPNECITAEAYVESFVVAGGDFAWQWLFYHGQGLVGVALMDQTIDAISLVYSFYDPGWRASSLGTFSILTQLLYAKSQGLAHAYPGYWVAANRSMSYKTRFRPYERLVRHPSDEEKPRWVRAA